LQLPGLKERILHSQIQLEEEVDAAKAIPCRNQPLEEDLELGL
jgi:hypothetical protein